MYINHLYYHSSSAITHTLTHILANAVKHADVRAYLFFSADREQNLRKRLRGFREKWCGSTASQQDLWGFLLNVPSLG